MYVCTGAHLQVSCKKSLNLEANRLFSPVEVIPKRISKK